jgi:nitroreductase
MDFFDVVRHRRSVRAFDERPVEPEKLRAILEAAVLAPSAGNFQAYEIYLAEDPGARARLAGALPQMDFFFTAPVSLIFCTNAARSAARYGDRGRNLYAVQDATIACTHAMLAANALGLGCVWVGAFSEQAIAEALDLPREHVPVAILPIGYPLDIPEARPRRPLTEIVHVVR